MDMLLGRKPLPNRNPVMGLVETATAMFGRASEISAQIQSAESRGVIPKGSPHYKFRTGKLRTFLTMADRYIDLGTRRVTAAKIEMEKKEGW